MALLKTFQVDNTTGAVATIDSIHHEVHEGEMFRAARVVSSLANGASDDVLVVTGTKDTHFAFEVAAGGLVSVFFYESPTVTDDGTAVPAWNMNRTSARTTDVTVFHTPTVSATGTDALVPGQFLPGGTSPITRVGGGLRPGVEWILAPETEYLVRVTNGSGAAVPVNIVCEFYEEDVI